ncbi:hypothetical protein [Geobacillus sp. TFV-3]|uniref:hypothetical protein n=1 Tax=Geobacillus sp. TFV-3 TaxID=1897059 RepID=UPI00135AA50B|nr:hypothetical protein [Geobacillus sp. TFV-3]
MENVITLFPLSQHSFLQSQAAYRKNLSFLLANMEQSLPELLAKSLRFKHLAACPDQRLARRYALLFSIGGNLETRRSARSSARLNRSNARPCLRASK